MIIVTGTRRCGTSMWMQVFEAAGFSIIGEQFPRDWDETLRETNPHGFYESRLRDGVFFATNPDPETGMYLFADDARNDVAKVFIHGLIRSERDYLDRVLASVRPWREYVASLRRMYAIEDALARKRGRDPAAMAEGRMPPALEWWDDNFALVSDIATRRYPCHVQSFDGVLQDPRAVMSQLFAWLGPELTHGRDLEAAIRVIKPSSRTQRIEPGPGDAALLEGIEPHLADVFDAYYAAVQAGSGLGALLVERMNEAQAELAGRIYAAREATQAAAQAFIGGPVERR